MYLNVAVFKVWTIFVKQIPQIMFALKTNVNKVALDFVVNKIFNIWSILLPEYQITGKHCLSLVDGKGDWGNLIFFPWSWVHKGKTETNIISWKLNPILWGTYFQVKQWAGLTKLWMLLLVLKSKFEKDYSKKMRRSLACIWSLMKDWFINKKNFCCPRPEALFNWTTTQRCQT